jgi:hypothetical protein
MYLEDLYEPDEILKDVVDVESPFESDEELYELSFETGREASEDYSLLHDEDVDLPQSLFAKKR